MKRSVLDTSILIRSWRNYSGGKWKQKTPDDARRWASQTIKLYDTDAIVTPVYLELVAGVSDNHELELTEAFLAEFKCVDGGNVTPADWEEALRIAQRVPRNGKPRQLGDCLIRAIANRLRYKVITLDADFPK
jgi:predicted nucleic acid-binding protein